MQNRHIISVVIFVLAVVLFLLIGLGWGGTDLAGWLIGALVGAAFAVAGLFFWRRGK